MTMLFRLLAACSILFFALPAEAASRVALVIGNGAYQNATELPNPANDAEAISAALEAIGFTVIKGIDLDHDAMEATLREYVTAMRDAEVALFYYSGHGLQVAGKNYLVPVDAKLEDETSLDFEMIDADKVFGYMGGNDRIAIAFLDACRDNPLSRRLARSLGATRSQSVGSGLAAPQTAGTGLFIGFSTAPGDVAADGTGDKSPFTEAILKHIATPGLEINQVMTRVKADVRVATNDDQRPWTNSDLSTDVFLVPAMAGGDVPLPVVTPVAPMPLVVAPDETHWQVIADSGVVGVFEEFIVRYPGSARRGEAEARIAALTPEPVVPAPHSATRDLALGEWKGSYVCEQGEAGLTLTFELRGETLVGEWSFYPIPVNPNIPDGVATFDMIVEDDGTLKSGDWKWIKRPSGYRAAPFAGAISADGGVFEGTMLLNGCTTFRVERGETLVADLPSDTPLPAEGPCGNRLLLASQKVDFSVCVDERVWVKGVPEGMVEHLYQTKDGSMYVATSPENTVAGFEQFRTYVLNNITTAPAVTPGSMSGLEESKADVGGRTWDVLSFDIVMGGVPMHLLHYRLSEVGFGTMQLLFASSVGESERATALAEDIIDTIHVGPAGERQAIGALAADEERWREIADSGDVGVLADFVETFPQSDRRADAEARIASLEAATAAGAAPCEGSDLKVSARIGLSFCLDGSYWGPNPQQAPPSEFGFLSKDGVLAVGVNPEVSVCSGPLCKQSVLDNVNNTAAQQNISASFHSDEAVTINGHRWDRIDYGLTVDGVNYRFLNYRLSEPGIGTVQFLFFSTEEFIDYSGKQAGAIMETVRFPRS